jgi:protein-disulfide isomerase
MPPLRREEPKRFPAGALLVAVACAALATAVLVTGSLLGARDAGDAPAAAAAPAARDPLLRGIAQDGIALGNPDAPVTVVEYADLQCPYCAQWAREAFPAIVRDYVRTGRVRFVFRGLAFIGPDSETALRAALAAGEQDRLWDVVHALFERQGHENAGWVTDDLMLGLGGVGLDAERMVDESGSPTVDHELDSAARAARAARVPGTPYFEAGRTGAALAPLRPKALDAPAFAAELERLLQA